LGCSLKELCPLPEEICYKYPEYMAKGKPRGCLYMHTLLTLAKLEHILPRYLQSLTRIISRIALIQIEPRTVANLLKILVILHDYGKAAEAYINTRHYYHEVLSGYVMYNVILQYLQRLHIQKDKEVAAVFSLATFLHHEHRIARVTRIVKKGHYLSKSVIEKVYKTTSVSKEANKAFETIIHKYVKQPLGIPKCEYPRHEIKDFYKYTLLQILASISTPRLFLSTTALNHILVITDIRAANQTRDKTRISKYFGTILKKGRN